MKKRILVLLCALPILTACPDPSPTPNNVLDPNVPSIIDPTPSPELAPTAQQEKLENVGMALVDECPAEDFENLASILETFASVDFESYNLDPLYEWADNVAAVSVKDTYIDNSTDNNYDRISDFELLVLLSNYHGLFTFANNTVTVSDYNGTKAVITIDGKKYEAEMTHKGTEKKAYCVFDYESNYSYSSEDYQYSNKYKSKTVIDVRVPEEINVTITENGSHIASVNAKFKAKFTESGLQPTVDAFATTTTISINQYSIVYDNSGYDGSASKAKFVRTLKKGDKALITTVATGDIQVDFNEYSWSDSGETWSESDKGTELVVNTAKNIVVAMDILGEVQIKGTCSDGKKFSEEYDAIYDALWSDGTHDTETANRHLDAAETYLDFGVYYNGSNKQADIELELQYEEYEWGYDYDVTPIIVFNDGSKVAPENYFTEDAFADLIDAVYELIEAYDGVFGFLIEEDDYYNEY